MKPPARSLLLLVCLALLATSQSKTWHGTWIATVGDSGTAFRGTWTATLADDPYTVTGTWTLINQAGQTLAGGTWSARKDEKTWVGGWRARGSANQLYAGSWQADSPLPSPGPISALFEFSLNEIARGTWTMGNYAGAWSIRAYPRR